MRWYPSSCPVCQGDLHDDPSDDAWVECMMCAREFRATEVLAVQRVRKVPAPFTAPAQAA